MPTDTFLNICKEVNSKLGMQGQFTSVDASGYQLKLVEFVSTAWRDLQHLRDDYYFLRASKDLTVVAGTQTYSLYNAGTDDIFTLAESQRFGSWRSNLFLYNYRPLTYVGYDEWGLADRTTATSTPSIFTINPADDSVIFQNLSSNATVTLNYLKSAQILENDTDVPEVPIKDRDVIMWKGLLDCASFWGNDDVKTQAEIGYEHSLGVFFRHQVPAKSVETDAIVLRGSSGYKRAI